MWVMADSLRGSMNADECKPLVPGLISLKHISDALEEVHSRLGAPVERGAGREDPDEYGGKKVFGAPREARRSHRHREVL